MQFSHVLTLLAFFFTYTSFAMPTLLTSTSDINMATATDISTFGLLPETATSPCATMTHIAVRDAAPLLGTTTDPNGSPTAMPDAFLVSSVSPSYHALKVKADGTLNTTATPVLRRNTPVLYDHEHLELPTNWIFPAVGHTPEFFNMTAMVIDLEKGMFWTGVFATTMTLVFGMLGVVVIISLVVIIGSIFDCCKERRREKKEEKAVAIANASLQVARERADAQESAERDMVTSESKASL